VDLLRVIALAFGLDRDALVDKCHAPDSECTARNSINTNLSFFRYYDYKNSYTCTQRCMVHQDNGLVTILAKYVSGHLAPTLCHYGANAY
jgi:isopenicillin N synthase-like dioxygenase